MYTPKGFHFENESEKIAFMKTYSFATIITNKKGLPLATQLPFVIRESEQRLVLSSHFALANEQASFIEHEVSLVIFSEPHAYISPGLYEKELNVPTWNYVAVHAYGDARLITDEQGTFDVLEETINNYEAGYKAQWDSLPVEYKLKLSRGIVAFEITVTGLQAKKKLSQNKTENEQKNIIDSLSSSQYKNERDIAAYMAQHLSSDQSRS